MGLSQHRTTLPLGVDRICFRGRRPGAPVNPAVVEWMRSRGPRPALPCSGKFGDILPCTLPTSDRMLPLDFCHERGRLDVEDAGDFDEFEHI